MKPDTTVEQPLPAKYAKLRTSAPAIPGDFLVNPCITATFRFDAVFDFLNEAEPGDPGLADIVILAEWDAYLTYSAPACRGPIGCV